MLMTVFVSTIVVLVFSLFTLMAIVPMLIETRDPDTLPESLVQLDQVRRRESTTGRPAA